MRKNLFFLFALICSMSLFTACSDDDGDENVNPYVGTYTFADYEAGDYTFGESTSSNWPSAGALYVDWKFTGDDSYPEFMAALFRHLGGAILPQVLNSVTLDKDGNVTADYVATPNVVMDASSVMSIFFTGSFPEKSTVTANFATSGFTASPNELATWTESNGNFTLKLNIAKILSASTDGDTSSLEEAINTVLNGQPATIKALLGNILGADLSGIQDATITQLVGWVKDGIPMKIGVADNGHTRIYLDKTAFDNLFTPRETGETDSNGDPEVTSDILILWQALAASGILPQEAEAAGILVALIGSYWPVTTGFDLGLDLVRK